MIWFSQREDWGHLYLHDLGSGQQKKQMTRGQGNVTQLLHVDEARRVLYFAGVGREAGRDPYFRHFYRSGMDGTGVELLTPEDADHDVSMRADGRFFVDTWSTPDTPAVSVVRDPAGAVVMELEKADISRLQERLLNNTSAVEELKRRDASALAEIEFDKNRLAISLIDLYEHGAHHQRPETTLKVADYAQYFRALAGEETGGEIKEDAVREMIDRDFLLKKKTS